MYTFPSVGCEYDLSLPLSPCVCAAAATVGLDAAGKTTLLYRLKLSEVVTTIPTIGQCCDHDLNLHDNVFDPTHLKA